MNNMSLLVYVVAFIVAGITYLVGTFTLDKKGDGPAIDRVLRERLFGLSKCIILLLVAITIGYIYYIGTPLPLLKALIPLNILALMYTCYKVTPNMFSPMVESYYYTCGLHGKSIGRRASIFTLCLCMATITVAGAISLYEEATYAGPTSMSYVIEYTALDLCAADSLASIVIASILVSNKYITTSFLFVGVLSCLWLIYHELKYTIKVHIKLKGHMVRYYLCLAHKLIIISLILSNLLALLFLQLSVNSIVSLVESDVVTLMENFQNYDITSIAKEAAHYFSTDMLATPICIVSFLYVATRAFIVFETLFIVLKIFSLVYTKRFIYGIVKAHNWPQYQTLISVLASSLSLRGIHDKKGSSKLIVDFYTYLLGYTKVPSLILFLTVVQVNTSFISALCFMNELRIIKKELL